VELFQVDNEGLLFISPTITDWATLDRYSVDTVIDLDVTVDDDVPTAPNHLLYVYFPITDDDLPNLVKLRAVATLGATLLKHGHCVLSHCGMGFNRSALVAGLILNQLGMSGSETVERLRSRRPGALFNDRFASYLQSLA
jgi:protein-tyrosine phosphatase